MKTINQLKQEWQKHIKDKTQWSKKVGQHHYFRSRYASKFWLDKVEEIYEGVKKEFIK